MNIILTASGALPSVTNGAMDVAQSETPTNRQNDAFVDFAAGVQSFCEWSLVAPFFYGGDPLTFNVYWTTTSSSTNAVVWGLQARAFSPGDAIDSPYGTAIEVTSPNTGANQEVVSATPTQPNALTVAGISSAHEPGIANSLVTCQRMKFRLYRLGSGADTLAATARVSMVRLLMAGPP